MLDTVILNNSVRRWLIAAAIILGSIFVGRLLNAFLKALGRKLHSKLAATFLEDIGGARHRPLAALRGSRRD